MMPMLYSLCQHQTIAAVQTKLRPGEHLLVFFDDTKVASQPQRSCEIHIVSRADLWKHKNPPSLLELVGSLGCPGR